MELDGMLAQFQPPEHPPAADAMWLICGWLMAGVGLLTSPILFFASK
jgi:hypothetical protein